MKFGSRERKCHRVILCNKSDYFKELFGPGKQFAESNQGVVELKDDDEEAVEALLRWIYTFEYEERQRNPIPCSTAEDKDDLPLNFHLNVCIAADKYLLPALRDEALGRLHVLLEYASETRLATFLQDVFYTGATFPTAIVALCERIRNSRLRALMQTDQFRDMVRNDSELGLIVADKLREEIERVHAAARSGLVQKRYTRCECAREGVGEKLAPGQKYSCWGSRCKRSIPAESDKHQLFWVKPP